MSLERLEIFTDAVLAIIMTILMLELQFPKAATISAILDLKFNFLAYATSFLICSLIWKQHHHLFRGAEKINGKIVWINIALIFCITFTPYLTVFVSENVDSIVAEVMYGLLFVLTTFVYFALYKALVSANPENKEKIDALSRKNCCPFVFTIILLGFVIGTLFHPPAILISCLVSLIIWMVPNKKEKKLLI